MSSRSHPYLLLTFLLFLLPHLLSAQQLPSSYNSSCLGCVLNGYKYCGNSRQCIDATRKCNSTLEYNVTTGCPVRSKCEAGLNGFLYLDTGNSAAGGLETSTDGSIMFTAPTNDTCALVFENLPRKSLTWQLSGANVAAQIVKVKFPTTVTTLNSQPQSPYTEFVMYSTDNTMVMYVGSLTAQNGTITLAWQNQV